MAERKVFKICSLCKRATEDDECHRILYGDWMAKSDIVVHYYCLLLSTNLLQRGKRDSCGILRFLICDIRKEINAAAIRQCYICQNMSASIECKKCKRYFHLTCGYANFCLFQFAGEFNSYCTDCIEVDEKQKKMSNKKDLDCQICKRTMGSYDQTKWIYAKCCSSGFVHKICMQKYALSAGYYLKCIFCKDKEFRETVKYQGVFVPDRDASWEREKGAYQDLYRNHGRCDMEVCNCIKGRFFTNGGKWKLILCKLCGSFGAHNPSCIPGHENSLEKVMEFKCETCSATEQVLSERLTAATSFASGDMDGSFYATKHSKNLRQSSEYNLPDFSDNTKLQESDTSSSLNQNETMDTRGDLLQPTLTQPEHDDQDTRGDLLQPTLTQPEHDDQETQRIVRCVVDRLFNLFAN